MKQRPQAATALSAPSSKTTLITSILIQEVVDGSRSSPRKRMILPFHKDADATLHRMLNGLQPDSYIRPHRHLNPPKAESIIVLQGSILSFLFSPEGKVEEIHTLTAGSPLFGVDCEPGVFHTFLALEEDTVLFEVKPGPYKEITDKDFAAWAPVEGTPEATEYLRFLYSFSPTAK